jgi:hypothetical protein
MEAGDIWARDEASKMWYYIREGTGDNLSSEDQDEGYVDYIYFDKYESLKDVLDNEEYDGGMYLLKKAYTDHTVEEIIKKINEFEDVDLKVIEAGPSWLK